MLLDWSQTSREVVLACDDAGVIVALDDRAARMLGLHAGDSLFSKAVAGTGEKLESLVREGDDPLEVSLVIDNQPRTVCFHRKKRDGVMHLFGSVLPDRYGNTVAQLSDALNEVVELNRQIAKQNRELDDSGRAVRALHNELAERAETIQRSADVKGRVVSNVSHEFRTPVHSILGLTRLLLDTTERPLDEEQRKQVDFIRQAASELSHLVDDLLDISRIESGRVMLHAEKFKASELFSALRGMMRPLRGAALGDLRFEIPANDVLLDTDQGKVAQIMRNLISNALKFTEQGEVAVCAETNGDNVRFLVKDVGIGIAPQHLDTIFEEFGQVDGPLQRKLRGTGLGLPLSRKLAELLGGTLTVKSEVGVGSTFVLEIPREHKEVREMAQFVERPIDPQKTQVLVVEDDRKTFFIYEKYLALAGFQAIPARSVEQAHRWMKTLRPAAIMLDIMLEGETSWSFLTQLKQNPETADIPVLVVTVTNKENKARALGADEFWLKPINPERLLKRLKYYAARPFPAASVLVIDDEESARYIVRKLLEGTPYVLLEAADGASGVRIAREKQPDIILLDFVLQEMTAFDVLDQLKSDPATRPIPVIIVTSHALDLAERSRLAAHTEAVLSKEHLSRELALNRIRDTLMATGVVRSIRDQKR